MSKKVRKTYLEALKYARKLNLSLDAYDFGEECVQIQKDVGSFHFIRNAFVLNWFNWYLVLCEHESPIVVSAEDGDSWAQMLKPVDHELDCSFSAIEQRRKTKNKPPKRKYKLPRN